MVLWYLVFIRDIQREVFADMITFCLMSSKEDLRDSVYG